MTKLDKKVTLCLSSEVYGKVKHFAKKHYFSSMQDYVRMSVLINVDVDEEKEKKEIVLK